MTGVVDVRVVGWVAFVLIVVGLIVFAVTRQSSGRLARSVGFGLGGLVALYLVGRAVAEFFTVNYSSSASYQDSWGGPSLVGVFLVHAGPGAAIVVALVGYLFHWWPRSRRTNRANKIATPQRQI